MLAYVAKIQAVVLCVLFGSCLNCYIILIMCVVSLYLVQIGGLIRLIRMPGLFGFLFILKYATTPRSPDWCSVFSIASYNHVELKNLVINTSFELKVNCSLLN